MSIRETNEQTMIAAHKAGIAYWRNNKPYTATRDSLLFHARTCGWHGTDSDNELTDAWLAGYYGAMARDLNLPHHAKAN